MRKLISICCVVPACVGALPAQAAPRSDTIEVAGKVNGICVMPATAPLTFSTTVPSNGKLDPGLSNLRWTITGIACNTGSRISIAARSLRINAPKTSLNPSQSQAVNFTATATGWAPTGATVTTGDTSPIGTTNYYTGAAKIQSSPKTGSITVSVNGFVVVGTSGDSSNSAKPLSGAYSATIVLTLAPST